MSSATTQALGQALKHELGASNLHEGSAAYAVDGLEPNLVVFPESLDSLSRVMAMAWEHNAVVAPRGGGTRTTLGNPIKRLDMVIDLSKLDGVIQHTPADMTVTVEAGLTLSGLQDRLAEHGQFLVMDPPLPDRATVGGTLAAGLTGPLKWQYGDPRDLVIGMKVVQADGKITKSGGQVMKNVSGYDMARLHTGALGTLGIIAEVSFKLFPLPRMETTIIALFDTHARSMKAGLGIFHSDVVPLALTTFDATVSDRIEVPQIKGRSALAIRLGGRPLTLDRQVAECIAVCRQHGPTSVETLDGRDAEAVWRSLADFGWDEKTTPALSGRVFIRPTSLSEVQTSLVEASRDEHAQLAVIAHPAHGTMQLHWFSDGGLSHDTAYRVLAQARKAAHDSDGRMIIERCSQDVKSRFDVWDDVGDSLAIMRNMKGQYDPKGVLNPGRFVGGI